MTRPSTLHPKASRPAADRAGALPEFPAPCLPIECPARTDLARWIEVHGAEVLAEVLDVTTTRIAAWCAGDARPPEELRIPLFILTGVRPTRWRTDDEARRNRTASVRARRRAFQIARATG